MERIKEALRKLTTEQIEAGSRTFEINGTQDSVLFDSCFVALMYGEENELNRDCALSSGCVLFAAEKLGIKEDTLGMLSDAHYYDAAALQEAVRQVLAERTAEAT